MDRTVIESRAEISPVVLTSIAYWPTRYLPELIEAGFWTRLRDEDFMRVAVILADKSYNEGGCPIGAVVVDNRSKRILGKGHNTLIQENHPYNHGETSAMRDAGSIDYSETTIFTTLTPCKICATLMIERGVNRVVIGNSPDPANSEKWLRDCGVEVVTLIDELGAALYGHYRKEKPEQDLVDWKGIAGLKRQNQP